MKQAARNQVLCSVADSLSGIRHYLDRRAFSSRSWRLAGMTRKKIIIKTRPASKASNGSASIKSFIPSLSFLGIRSRINGMTDPQTNKPENNPTHSRPPVEFCLSKELAEDQRTGSDVGQIHDFLCIHLPLVACEPFHTSAYPSIQRILDCGRSVKFTSTHPSDSFIVTWLFNKTCEVKHATDNR